MRLPKCKIVSGIRAPTCCQMLMLYRAHPDVYKPLDDIDDDMDDIPQETNEQTVHNDVRRSRQSDKETNDERSVLSQGMDK
jgi:hypothetical protein